MKPLNVVNFITVLILASLGVFSTVLFINNLDHWHLLFISIACFILILTIYKSKQ